MKQEPYVPPAGPPQGPPPSKEIYAALGETGVHQMMADFYIRLGASKIRHLFPPTAEGLIEASKRNAAFFIQILGGPPTYTAQFGPPQLRKRHLAFEITVAAKDEWLACFFEILEDAPQKYGFPTAHMDGFKAWLSQFAAWMVNRAT